jgi:hypothetical protein
MVLDNPFLLVRTKIFKMTKLGRITKKMEGKCMFEIRETDRLNYFFN